MKCMWSPPLHAQHVFDLGPLAKQRDITFESGSGVENMLAGTPFAEFFGNVMGGGPQQTIVISVCGDTRGNGDAACRGERAPGVITERSSAVHALVDGHIELRPAAQSKCLVLGRRAGGPKFALLDDANPEAGLQLLYEKGDECSPGRRASLLFMLRCSLDVRAQGINERLQADVQRRDKCQWVVSITTSAACPVNAGPQTTCAPNCPRTWLGDGECDPGCSNRACGWDGGDCERGSRPEPPSQQPQCAPGCVEGWRGDGECDEECNTDACRWDGGDCNGVCAPGCAERWRGDGECDDECNTGTCQWDGGDCLRNGRPVARSRCAWGCPSAWLGDGQCDMGCNVTGCGFDHGDCVASWRHHPVAREPAGEVGEGGLRRPTSATLLAHADLPLIGAKVQLHADTSSLNVPVALGTLTATLALVFCCCGAGCVAILAFCLMRLRGERPRYAYAAVAMHPAPL